MLFGVEAVAPLKPKTECETNHDFYRTTVFLVVTERVKKYYVGAKVWARTNQWGKQDHYSGSGAAKI